MSVATRTFVRIYVCVYTSKCIVARLQVAQARFYTSEPALQGSNYYCTTSSTTASTATTTSRTSIVCIPSSRSMTIAKAMTAS